MIAGTDAIARGSRERTGGTTSPWRGIENNDGAQGQGDAKRVEKKNKDVEKVKRRKESQEDCPVQSGTVGRWFVMV